MITSTLNNAEDELLDIVRHRGTPDNFAVTIAYSNRQWIIKTVDLGSDICCVGVGIASMRHGRRRMREMRLP